MSNEYQEYVDSQNKDSEVNNPEKDKILSTMTNDERERYNLFTSQNTNLNEGFIKGMVQKLKPKQQNIEQEAFGALVRAGKLFLLEILEEAKSKSKSQHLTPYDIIQAVNEFDRRGLIPGRPVGMSPIDIQI